VSYVLLAAREKSRVEELQILSCNDAELGLEMFLKITFSTVIVDLVIPKMSGMGVREHCCGGSCGSM
jgi:DNA-binding response OmpR family regulator